MIYDLKTQITSFVFAFCCIGLYFLFPIDQYKFEIIIGILVFLVILPVLYTRIILHEDVRSLGCGSFRIDSRDIMYLVGSVIVAAIVSFGIIKMQWGVEAYVNALSPAVLYDFRGFAIYELVFSLVSIFLFTFFSWGFVYHKTWVTQVPAYIVALFAFLVLIANYYQSAWMVVPVLFPAAAYFVMRDRVHIFYVFCAFFVVNLVIDTLIIMSL